MNFKIVAPIKLRSWIHLTNWWERLDVLDQYLLREFGGKVFWDL